MCVIHELKCPPVTKWHDEANQKTKTERPAFKWQIFVQGTSLVAQWLRIHLSMQGLWVRFLVRDLRSYLLLLFSCYCHVPLFCKTRDCSPPGSSVHGNSQARILVWAAISSSRGSFQTRDQTLVSCIAGGIFTAGPPGKPKILHDGRQLSPRTTTREPERCH